MSLRSVFKRSLNLGALFAPIVCLLALVVYPVTGRAQEERGKRAFEANCASCHGNSGEGGAGPSLVPLRYDDRRLLEIVRRGGAQMPGVAGPDQRRRGVGCCRTSAGARSRRAIRCGAQSDSEIRDPD